MCIYNRHVYVIERISRSKYNDLKDEKEEIFVVASARQDDHRFLQQS